MLGSLLRRNWEISSGPAGGWGGWGGEGGKP
jgi:hypothetical protein